MSTIEIRRVTHRDLVDVIAGLPSRPAEEHRRRLEAQDRGGFAYLIAWIGRVPVGFVGVGLREAWAASVLSESRGYAKVRDLWVSESFRRRGVGRALMIEIEGEARDAGMPGLILDTGTGDHFAAARQLYRSLGYLDQGGVYLGGWTNPDRPGEHVVDTLTIWVKPF